MLIKIGFLVRCGNSPLAPKLDKENTMRITRRIMRKKIKIMLEAKRRIEKNLRRENKANCDAKRRNREKMIIFF